MQAEEAPRPPAESEFLDLEINIQIVQVIKKLQANSLFFEFVYSLKGCRQVDIPFYKFIVFPTG
ncbi:hypothetical protein BKC07_21245 [Peribacillus simplex]|nr:hypothetical protein BKC07_21245 [Peribacillus simplex]